MGLKEIFGFGHDLGAKKNSQDRQNAKADEASTDDGGQEVGHLHLEHAGGEDEQLEWRRRRQHGGDHQGQELLPFKAVADALQSCLADSFQQKQLASRASKKERDQASRSRS